jgi:hypothetical protein
MVHPGEVRKALSGVMREICHYVRLIDAWRENKALSQPNACPNITAAGPLDLRRGFAGLSAIRNISGVREVSHIAERWSPPKWLW